MPYIKIENRKEINAGRLQDTAGELNFVIFSYVKYNLDIGLSLKKDEIKKFVDDFLGEKPNYQRWNDMTGCLIRCQKEIKRRLGFETKMLEEIMESYDKIVDDYEDVKIEQNGDIE